MLERRLDRHTIPRHQIREFHRVFVARLKLVIVPTIASYYVSTRKDFKPSVGGIRRE